MVSEATRHVMQANKSKNTKPELKVRAALRRPFRVSPPLEGRARQARHLLSRSQGGDLRQRLLLASLPVLRPLHAKDERGVLDGQVRAKPRP